MRSAGEYAVILFYSTSYAIRGEKVMNQAGITNKLIPVPRQISSDCGVCLCIGRDEQDAALQALAEARVDVYEVHDI